jgi:hypothetical protein
MTEPEQRRLYPIKTQPTKHRSDTNSQAFGPNPRSTIRLLETTHCDLFDQSVGDKLLAESGDAPSRLRRELSRTAAMERGSGHA